MANVNKVKVNNTVYDIEDTVARSSTVTMSSRADGSVSLSSASAGTSVNVPSLTNFGDPGLLEDDAVTEINTLKTDVSDLKSQISDIEEEIEGGTGSGMSSEFKVALENLVNHLAYKGDDPTGRSYITALHNAMYPPARVSRITAVFTQSRTVYTTDSLDSLKNDLIVTAVYSDATTEVVSDYTLSGILAIGTSVITVSYSNKTTTFNVIVAENTVLYHWDFTQSVIDTEQGAEFTLGEGVTITSNGIYYDAVSDGVSTTGDALLPAGGSALVKFGQMVSNTSGATGGNGVVLQAPALFGYRGASSKWSTWYGTGWHDDECPSLSEFGVNALSNKSLVIDLDVDGEMILTVDGVEITKTNGLGATSGSSVRFGHITSNKQSYRTMYIEELTIYSTPSRTLSSISATFNQGDNIVYDADGLNRIKKYLTVTAAYDNGTFQDVSDYTLSGTLQEGTSTVTVTYLGKTTTFTVTVTHEANVTYSVTDYVMALDDTISTHVDLISQDQDYTIALDVELTNRQNAWKLYWAYENQSPWRGLTIGRGSTSSSALNCKVGTNYSELGSSVSQSVTHLRVVLTHVQGSGKWYAHYRFDNASTVSTKTISDTFVALDPNSVMINGHITNLWAGTINVFKILSVALTTAEATAFLEV